MSHSEAEHQNSDSEDQAKLDSVQGTSNPQPNSSLDEISIGMDDIARSQPQPGLSPDRLKQIADQINANLNFDKSGVEIETDWDETKSQVRVNLDDV